MKNITFLALLIATLLATFRALPQNDSVIPPGMINQTVYSGYLSTTVPTRKIHYVFIAARTQPQKAPLTVWFNGGPGCSSLIGMIQQIGPYLVGNNYTQGDLLTRNPYSWNQVSNLLFLQSPAIVGFSTDKDPQFHYTDAQTGDDAFAALKDFLFVKATEFLTRQLYLSGESYAGKYVPDVAVRILNNNQGPISQYINLKGIIVGNGVMNFKDNSLDKSEIQYMYEHDFLDDRLWTIYRDSCRKDFHAPRCKYFQYEMRLSQDNVNPYNVYEVCKDVGSAQVGRMVEAIRQFRKMSETNKNKQKQLVLGQQDQGKQQEKIQQKKIVKEELKTELKQINQCPNDNGAISYWNLNKYHYKVDHVNKTWSPCTHITYSISENGSMDEYRRIFLNQGIRVWLFNGDWDDVVPYRDTEKSLQQLKVHKVGEWDPWFWGEHHAGFYQIYEKLTLITVKGASHMVPQTKPRQSYQMFYNFIKNRPINTPVQLNIENQNKAQQKDIKIE